MKKLFVSLVALGCLALPVVASADHALVAPHIVNNIDFYEPGKLMLYTNILENSGKIGAKVLFIQAKNIKTPHDKALGIVCWRKRFTLNAQRVKFHDPRCNT